MRLTLTSPLIIALGACVAAEPGGDRSAMEPLEAAIGSPVPAEPIPISASSRPESDVKRMSASEIAGWVLPPAEAARIARVETVSGFVPWMSYAGLYEAPRAYASLPGLCEARGWGIFFRIENESRLSQQQRLDPPLDPYQRMPVRGYRIIGSTIAEPANPPQCAAAAPYREWFEAPSAEAAHQAVRLVEQAQARRAGYSLSCTSLRSEEGKADFVTLACPDARLLLGQLRPHLIKRVGAASCDGLARATSGRCWGIEYHDPQAPGTHSIYSVRIAAGPARSGPTEVHIAQGMLPPH
jgi:hypothetical protein